MTKSDAELNKAALLIAKFLLRTREGRISWQPKLRKALVEDCQVFVATLESGITAHISKGKDQLGFELIGSENTSGQRGSVLSLFLSHSYKDAENLSPESIVYEDIEELLQLAENPKSVSDDLQYKQALSYLDKLTA